MARQMDAFLSSDGAEFSRTRCYAISIRQKGQAHETTKLPPSTISFELLSSLPPHDRRRAGASGGNCVPPALLCRKLSPIDHLIVRIRFLGRRGLGRSRSLPLITKANVSTI